MSAGVGVLAPLALASMRRSLGGVEGVLPGSGISEDGLPHYARMGPLGDNTIEVYANDASAGDQN